MTRTDPPHVAPLPARVDKTTNEVRPETDEEREFVMAVERYKRLHRRPYPTWLEVLHVVHHLGYRRGDVDADGRRVRPPEPAAAAAP